MEKAQTLEELKNEREKLNKQIAAIEIEEKRKILAQVHELVSKAGLTVEDVFGHGAKKAKRQASSAPAKYRHPDGRTWTGIGRKPTWISEALASGKTLESFAV